MAPTSFPNIDRVILSSLGVCSQLHYNKQFELGEIYYATWTWTSLCASPLDGCERIVVVDGCEKIARVHHFRNSFSHRSRGRLLPRCCLPWQEVLVAADWLELSAGSSSCFFHQTQLLAAVDNKGVNVIVITGSTQEDPEGFLVPPPSLHNDNP